MVLIMVLIVMVLIMVLIVMVPIMIFMVIIILVTLSSLRLYESLVASWLTINQRKMKSTPATLVRIKMKKEMKVGLRLRLEMMATT